MAMKSMFVLLLAVLLSNCMLVFTMAAETKASSGNKLKSVQGEWERELTPEDIKAGLRRAVKEIKGNKERSRSMAKITKSFAGTRSISNSKRTAISACSPILTWK